MFDRDHEKLPNLGESNSANAMVVGKWLPFPLFHSALFELLILLDWNSPSPKKSLPKKFHAGSCFRSLHAVGRGQTLRKHQLFGGYRCSILV